MLKVNHRRHAVPSSAALMACLLLTVMVAILMMAASPAWAKTFTVNSTGDVGDEIPGDGICATFSAAIVPECTLRAAIQEANADTASDTINFNISGSGVKVISPATTLLTVTQPVIIDGYTQPGATANTKTVGNDANLLIRLDKGAGSVGSGLLLDTNNSVVRGLSITGFSSGVGIIVRGDNNVIEGNFIGTDPGDTQAGLGNFNGVIVQDNSSNNLIGGTSPAARNILSGNGREGVRITTNSGETNNKVVGNYIGTTKSGTGELGNGKAGVIVDSSNHTIGGATPAAANVIAFNGQFGVLVGDVFPQKTQGVSILGNSIFSNGGLGIALDDDGVSPNDGPGDADNGPNNLQNFPVITSAKTGERRTTIRGTLESTQTGTFTIQFFKSPKDTKDEGKKFIGEKTVEDTDGDGIIPFTFRPPKKVKAGLFVTATATNAATDDTSEFSAPRKVR